MKKLTPRLAALSLSIAAAFVHAQSEPRYEFRAPKKGLSVSATASTPVPPPAPAPTYLSETSSLSVNFDPTLVGSSQMKSVVFSNVGTGTLSLWQPQVSGTGFSATTSCGASLAPGASCYVDVTFAPTQRGTASGSVSFGSNAQGAPAIVTLSGLGTQVAGALTPLTSMSFGAVNVGSSVSRQFTFANSGNIATSAYASLGTASGLTMSANTCGTPASPATVMAGDSCSMTVTWSPVAAGSLSAALSVHSLAPDSPSSVNLSGTAVVPNPVGDGSSTAGACASGEASGCSGWNPATAIGATVQANTQIAVSGGYHTGVDSAVCKSSGKWYVEVRRTTNLSPSANLMEFGVHKFGASKSYAEPSEFYWYAADGDVYRTGVGTKLADFSDATVLAVNTWVGIALDLDAAPKTATLRSGSEVKTVTLANSSGSFCVSAGYMHNATVVLNAGQQDFQYAPPVGHQRGLY